MISTVISLIFSLALSSGKNYVPQIKDNKNCSVATTAMTFETDVEEDTSVFIDDAFYGDTYLPNQSFTSRYYRHLYQNIPTNSFGICGYTGIAMLLSHYDAYWNDNFIDEWFENSTPTSLTSSDYNEQSTGYYHSPGVGENMVFGYGYNLQHYRDLVVDEHPGIVIDSDEFNYYLDAKITPMVYEQIQDNSFLGKLFYSAIATGVLTPHRDMNGVLIDEDNYITSLSVNYGKVNAILNNYIQNNQYLNNSVSLVKSRMSTYNINDSDYQGEKQRIRSEIIEILQSGRPVLVGGNHWENGKSVGHACIAYSYDSAHDIITGNIGGDFSSATVVDLDDYFNIRYKYYFSLYFDDTICGRTNNYYFSDKSAYYSPKSNVIFNVIQPTDFGFPDAYNQTEVSSVLNIKTPDSYTTAESVSVKRVRTGYIHNECVNLSTKKRAPGIAYLELDFPRDIKTLIVDISWWSDNEMVTSQNSSYYIQGKTGSIYYNFADIWYEGLPTDRTHPRKLVVDFEQGVDVIRFYGSTTDYTNDRNKGRLSIFDMIVEYWNF